jgi:hypothetical protein
VILVVVNLDAHHEQGGVTWLDLEALGLDHDEHYTVTDLLGGGVYSWHGPDNFVLLDPNVIPAHVFHVRPSTTDVADELDPAAGHHPHPDPAREVQTTRRQP